MAVMTQIQLICWCCGNAYEPRDPATDPWNGRLDGYCEFCADNRCDHDPTNCPNILLRR